MPESVGVLRYSFRDAAFRLVMDIDPGLTSFYRSLVPKSVTLRPQRHAPHATVVREEDPPNRGAWAAHEGLEVPFRYLEEIRNDEVYWWLEVYCPRLTAVRLELGLPASSRLTRPPDGKDCFHTTLGNTKS